jgi:uncharacterized protein (UPF0147 family)
MITENEKNLILEDIRLIKKVIEDSSIPLPVQFNCIDAMQRILNNCQIDN